MGTYPLNPQATKFHDFYWEIAHNAASQSYCERHKVGAVVVTATGMLSVGWNGSPVGLPNVCESPEGKTLKTTLHAERNAIDKMTRQGIPTAGSLLFVTRAPCFECAKTLHGLGFKAILYEEDHDDMDGVDLLRRTGNTVLSRYSSEVKMLNRHYHRGPA